MAPPIIEVSEVVSISIRYGLGQWVCAVMALVLLLLPFTELNGYEGDDNIQDE